MYESLSIFTDGWEEDCARPLSTMKQVATRLGVFGSDLDFVDWSSEAGMVVAHYFTKEEMGQPKPLVDQAIYLFNQACQAKEAKQYQLAEQLFEGSIRLVPEQTEHDRALKGLILYQYGVFLLHSNELENKRGNLSEEEFGVVRRINDLWAQTRRLVEGIPVKTLKSFAFPILNALHAIEEDQWIRMAGITKVNPTTGKL